MKRLLVAVDGSRSASRAALFAARLARETGATLEMIHVYDAPTAVALGLGALSREDLASRSSHFGEGHFEAAETVIGDLIEPLRYVALGHPAEQIVLRADETGADLIVIGTRGQSDLKGLLLGSVSRRVVFLTKCPVTVVP